MRTDCGHVDKKKNAKSLFLKDLALPKSTPNRSVLEPIFTRFGFDLGVKKMDTQSIIAVYSFIYSFKNYSGTLRGMGGGGYLPKTIFFSFFKNLLLI